MAKKVIQSCDGVRKRGFARIGGVAMGLLAMGGGSAEAVDYYWNATSGTWATSSNWNTTYDGGVNATNFPLTSSDGAFFSASGVSNTTVNLSASRTVSGLRFLGTNTGTTGLLKDGSGALSIGSGGVTVESGAGAVLFGISGAPVTATLLASQTWANNSSNALTQWGTVTTGGFKLTAGGSGDTVFKAAISGLGALIKDGGGTVTLAGSNPYTGGTTVNAGILNVTAVNGIRGKLNVTGGTLNNSLGITLSGTLELSGSGTIAGGLITANGDITVSGTGATTISAGMGGGGGMTKSGSGTLTVSGANSSTGSMTLQEGTVVVGVGSGISTGALLVEGGSLVLGGRHQTVDSLMLTGGSITGTGSLTSGATFELKGLGNTSVGPALNGTSIGLTKTGAGTATLSGANGYDGTTLISEGTLEIGGSGQLSGGGAINIEGGTLLLSGVASDRVADTTPVTLGSTNGTSSALRIAGSVTETFGALTLSGEPGGFRVIDFGSGSGILNFASLESGTAGLPVQIWNWSGNVWIGGGTDQLKITSALLGANILLSDITIFSDSGVTTVRTGEVAWANGELVAIPEVSGALGGLALLLPLAWRERRQWWRGAALRTS